ncbi:MAG: hypothetical protein HY905_21365 [Deltaproteobacteria bacterium]|nr:hypothetical protein [Deltaproteobacteria bacterium]
MPVARGVVGYIDVVGYVLRICGFRESTVASVVDLLRRSEEMRPTIETPPPPRRKLSGRKNRGGQPVGAPSGG